MALAPFSGSSPEWAARPKARMVKRSDPLRRVLRWPAGSEGGLQHEDPPHPARQALDAGDRLDAADLLVGVDEEGRLGRGDKPQVAEGPQGEDPLHEPRFHVEDPGAGEAAVADLHRHRGQGAHRPDGVAVADQELGRQPPPPLPGDGPELAAGPLPRQAARAHPCRLELRGEAGEDRLLGGGLVGGGFEEGEVAQQRGHLVPAGAEVVEEELGGRHEAGWYRRGGSPPGVKPRRRGRGPYAPSPPPSPPPARARSPRCRRRWGGWGRGRGRR